MHVCCVAESATSQMARYCGYVFECRDIGVGGWQKKEKKSLCYRAVELQEENGLS